MWNVSKPSNRRTTTKTRLNNATGGWNLPRKFAESTTFAVRQFRLQRWKRAIQ